MEYKIIQTGSKGNALLLGDELLVDCGVSFKKLKDEKIRLVLLTHEHKDHFNAATIRRLGREHPLMRFGCPPYLVSKVADCGIRYSQIDIYKPERIYAYSDDLAISTFPLFHDALNVGYKVRIGDEKIFYAADTSDLAGIEAKGYDWYFIEANYEEEELQERIAEKMKKGDFCYETRVAETHLSKEQAERFVCENRAPHSNVLFIHRHTE